MDDNEATDGIPYTQASSDALAVADALALHAAVIREYGGSDGVIDEGKLEAALMRPRMAAYYEGADVIRQAALVMAAVALAHAFVDGNKRTATVLGLLLLDRNGITIVADSEAIPDLIVALVVDSNHMAATNTLEGWLRTHWKPLAEVD